MTDPVDLGVITVGAEPGTNGVPGLSTAGTSGINVATPTLANADNLVGFSYISGPQWGIYKGSSGIIVFDTFLAIDFRQTWNISDYPVEQGGFESYNKVYTPFETRVNFASGGSEANRTALLASIAAVAGDLNLYTIVTPEAVYSSVNIKHYDYHRTATNGVGLLTVGVWFEEVRVTVSESSNTSLGTSAGAQNGSDVSAPTNNFSSGGATGSWDSNPTIEPFGAARVNNGVTTPITPSVDYSNINNLP